MLQLSSDEGFHFEILRSLSHARYFGADVGEVLKAAGVIEATFSALNTRADRLMAWLSPPYDEFYTSYTILSSCCRCAWAYIPPCIA